MWEREMRVLEKAHAHWGLQHQGCSADNETRWFGIVGRDSEFGGREQFVLRCSEVPSFKLCSTVAVHQDMLTHLEKAAANMDTR
jgi:hypothetical protein